MINNLKGIHGNQTKLSSIFNNPNMNVKKFTKFGSQNILKCYGIVPVRLTEKFQFQFGATK